MVNHALSAVSTYFRSKPTLSERSASDFALYCSSSQTNSDIFVCDGYRYCRAAKLLMALGYGNFDTVVQYDIYAMAERYVADGNKWDTLSFQSSDYFLKFGLFESPQILNSPIFRFCLYWLIIRFVMTIIETRNGSLLSRGLVT